MNARTPRSPKKPGSEFLAIDKRNCVIHEAGHAIVALKLGASHAKLTVDRDHSRDLATEVAFRAQCTTSVIKGKLKVAARAYAGVIAEILYEDFDVDTNLVWEYIDTEITNPSPSDMIWIQKLAPQWRMRAVHLSLQILMNNWTAVRGVAYELHESRSGLEVFGPSIFEKTNWRGLL